ncbi:redoxin domain-containing protein [Halobacillus halophilus]|uniref:redoxin domain-containing protein n=1 Tax=Halobacillus halophilus TaxID=1570 RepID=UPI001CD54432|nr:redoxin domain-containing protein [Halobacillus halophilus]MCA1011899.1 redoxin domain-containing protein [Halobacillus halophilus]
MKRWIIILTVTALFGWAIYDFAYHGKASSDPEEEGTTVTTGATDERSTEPENGKTGLEKGQQAPDFTLQTLEGEEVSLSDYRGKKVMINFWATWCPPCRAEMPDMEKFYQNEDIVILAVNLTETESGLKEVQEFRDEFDLSFPILLDKKVEVANKYQINPVPTSVFVDEDGKIDSVMLGAMNYDMMLQRLEAL